MYKDELYSRGSKIVVATITILELMEYVIGCYRIVFI
jgi:hypothetical protein